MNFIETANQKLQEWSRQLEEFDTKNLLMVIRPILVPLFELLAIAATALITFKVGSETFKLDPLQVVINTGSLLGLMLVSYFSIKAEKEDIFDKSLYAIVFLFSVAFAGMLSVLYFTRMYPDLGLDLDDLADTGKLVYVTLPAIVLILGFGISALASVVNVRQQSGEIEIATPGDALAFVAAPALKILGVLVSGLHTLEYGQKILQGQPLVAAVNMVVIELLTIVAVSKAQKASKKKDIFDVIAWSATFVIAAGYLLLVNIAYLQDLKVYSILSPDTMDTIRAAYGASGIAGVLIVLTITVITSAVNLVQGKLSFGRQKSELESERIITKPKQDKLPPPETVDEFSEELRKANLIESFAKDLGIHPDIIPEATFNYLMKNVDSMSPDDIVKEIRSTLPKK